MVTDFTDHDHVRVLTQNGSQTTGKGHLGFGVDRRLADTRQVIFHRIFDGQNIARLVVKMAEGGVQTGGFA